MGFMLVLMYDLLMILISSHPTEPGKTKVLHGCLNTDDEDAKTLEQLSASLIHREKDEMFNAVHQQYNIWRDEGEYDTWNPFGDSRENILISSWIFDIPNDTLYYTTPRRRREIPLSLLRDRPVHLSEIPFLDAPFPPPLELPLDPHTLYWTPQARVDDRKRAFVSRLLNDFHHEWRHVHRNRYNAAALRHLARAIIRLCTLDFEVRSRKDVSGSRSSEVSHHQLPAWEPFRSDIVGVGSVTLILCQTIKDGLSIVQDQVSRDSNSHPVAHHTSPQSSREDEEEEEEEKPHYIVLTGKHITLCRATSLNTFVYTAPEPLFNGDPSATHPSDRALYYLIWATSSALPSLTIPRALPVEIQDLILSHMEVEAIETARLGCLMNWGMPVLWRHDDLRLEVGGKVWPGGSYYAGHHAVETRIWLGEQKSGLVYLSVEDKKG